MVEVITDPIGNARNYTPAVVIGVDIGARLQTLEVGLKSLL